MTSGSENMDGFDFQMTPDQRAQGEWEIANVSRITMHQFKIVSAVLFGIALRRLHMDDGFLTVALACLCGGTVILYERIQIMYLESAILQKNRTALQNIASEQMDDLYDQSKWRFAYIAMSNWRDFILYYRFSICFSVVSWLFGAVGAQLIACTYFGRASSRCFPESVSNTMLLLTLWTFLIFDALTDIMVISISIVGLGCFMCLSAFMVSCSIIRIVGTYNDGVLDCQWMAFWLHSEACIGVMMGSITIYHPTLLTGSKSGVSWLARFKNFLGSAVIWSEVEIPRLISDDPSRLISTSKRSTFLPLFPETTGIGILLWIFSMMAFGYVTAEGSGMFICCSSEIQRTMRKTRPSVR
ncbi:hypothetical protein V8E54_012428 [Elaphomyces granulatus]